LPRVEVLPSDWREQVLDLAEQRDAVILAHNYQVPEIQDIAHHTGDSLGLSRIAAEVDASTIVFCGVHFMAETAKILSPDKTVLIPDARPGAASPRPSRPISCGRGRPSIPAPWWSATSTRRRR
jgi:quinolinate synthase